MVKRKLLNIRSHLEHIRLVISGLEKYGMCPLLEDELKRLKVMNELILAKNAKQSGRKDIRH